MFTICVKIYVLMEPQKTYMDDGWGIRIRHYALKDSQLYG